MLRSGQAVWGTPPLDHVLGCSRGMLSLQQLGWVLWLAGGDSRMVQSKQDSVVCHHLGCIMLCLYRGLAGDHLAVILGVRWVCMQVSSRVSLPGAWLCTLLLGVLVCFQVQVHWPWKWPCWVRQMLHPNICPAPCTPGSSMGVFSPDVCFCLGGFLWGETDVWSQL